MKEVTEGIKDLSCFHVLRESTFHYDKEGIVAVTAHNYGVKKSGTVLGVLQKH